MKSNPIHSTERKWKKGRPPPLPSLSACVSKIQAISPIRLPISPVHGSHTTPRRDVDARAYLLEKFREISSPCRALLARFALCCSQCRRRRLASPESSSRLIPWRCVFRWAQPILGKLVFLGGWGGWSRRVTKWKGMKQKVTIWYCMVGLFIDPFGAGYQFLYWN